MIDISFLRLTVLFLLLFALRTISVRVARKNKSRLVRHKKSDVNVVMPSSTCSPSGETNHHDISNIFLP